MNLKSRAFHIYRLVPGSFQCSLNQITYTAADFSVHWPWRILWNVQDSKWMKRTSVYNYQLQIMIQHRILKKLHPCVHCWLMRLFYSHLLSRNLGVPGGSVVKNPSANPGDTGSISGSGGSPVGGHGNPLQHSCLGNPMKRGVWRATVHGVAKTQTQLSN